MKQIVLILLCTIGLSANAQVTTLTLKDAINYALVNKSDAKKSKLEVENSEFLQTEILLIIQLFRQR
jgi:outer membrane protein